MMDTKRLRERTDVLSFFINIPILERGSGMKSFSAFITEERRKGGRTGNMKFPGDDAYRRMQDELSKKEKTKPRTVKQSEVSQQAKDYRTAEGEKRYQAAKTDVEARRGFQTGKGGLKADESNPYVNRQVRQQRAVKQGVPDPFKSKTPAPSDPFKGLRTGSKSQVPDPFKGASSPGPKPKSQGPEQKLRPGPAETEARRNIRASQARIDATKPGTKPNLRSYVKSQTGSGYKVSPELEDALLRGRSSDTEVRVGGDTAPSRKPRTSGKPASAAVNTARASGDYRVANPPKKPVSVKSSVMGPETKRSAITRDLAAAKPETRKLYRASPRSSSFTEFSRRATDIQRNVAKTPVLTTPKPSKSAGVPKSRALAKQFGNPMRQGAYDAFMARVDRAKVKVDEPKALPSGKKALPGTAPIKPVDVTVGPPKTQKPKALPGTVKPPKKPSSIKLPPARKTAALTSAAKNAPLTQAGLNKTLRGIGGRALGLAGAGYDAVSSYQEYKKRGDSDWRAGLKSAFRTGLGYAGGALGGLAGVIGGGGIGSAVTGTAGAIGGYSAGTWLADKVLGATRYERKKRAREKAAAKAAANQK